jgi:hypothetical protein
VHEVVDYREVSGVQLDRSSNPPWALLLVRFMKRPVPRGLATSDRAEDRRETGLQEGTAIERHQDSRLLTT